MKLPLIFWKSNTGNEPVREWLKGMAAEARKAVGDDLRYVQENWPLGKPHVDGFGDGLYEVRARHDKMNYRVLFCIEDDTMILLHGFIKKTPKTPAADVALARRRQKE